MPGGQAARSEHAKRAQRARRRGATPLLILSVGLAAVSSPASADDRLFAEAGAVDKAEVSVRGRPAGTAPIAEELFADAGTVTVEAGAPGHEPAKQTFEAKKGEARDLEVALVPIQKPEARSMLGPAIAFGVGGAGLVLGAVTAGVAVAGKSRLSETCAPSGACDESARGELDTALTMARVSTAGFIVAGLGAAVGVTLLLLPTKPRPTVAVQVGPGFVGVKGTF